MLSLSDLAKALAEPLIKENSPLKYRYWGIGNSNDSDSLQLPTGDDIKQVKADVQGGIDKANQEIANLKNEMENVGFKVMSHIPDLANGTDLDTSTIKDPRTAISTYTLQQKNGTSDDYIDLTTPVTQTMPLMLGDNPSPYQIQIKIEVHDYPNGAIPWYYFRMMPYAKIVAIRVKRDAVIVNSFTQSGNDTGGLIYEGMTLPLSSTIAHLGSYSWTRTNLSTPQSILTSPPKNVDYTDPRDGKNYNDTPAMMVIIPYGDWDAKNKNGSWSITQGSTAGGLYIAVYKGKCICYDIQVRSDPTSGGNNWTKRYAHYASGYDIATYGLNADYIGPDGQHTISYK